MLRLPAHAHLSQRALVIYQMLHIRGREFLLLASRRRVLFVFPELFGVLEYAAIKYPLLFFLLVFLAFLGDVIELAVVAVLFSGLLHHTATPSVLLSFFELQVMFNLFIDYYLDLLGTVVFGVRIPRDHG